VKKPFFRASHKCWYVKNDERRFVRLDPDEETAFEMWRQMLGGKFSQGPKVTIQTLVRIYLEANHSRSRNTSIPY